jgi:hypothetical protein
MSWSNKKSFKRSLLQRINESSMAVAVAGENWLEINDAKKREGKPSEETFWQ